MSASSQLAEGDAILAAERELFLAREEMDAARNAMPHRSIIATVRWSFLGIISFGLSLTANINGMDWLRLFTLIGSVFLILSIIQTVRDTKAARRSRNAVTAFFEAQNRYDVLLGRA